MEAQLKAKKLASASTRRQRFHERQKHKEIMAEQREEWRKRRQRYSEIYKTDSDASRSNSPEHDSATDSPAEDSVRTPGSLVVPDVEFNISISDLTLERFAGSIVDDNIMRQTETTEWQGWNTKTYLPTLVTEPIAPTRTAAPHAHRFSTVIDSIGVDIAPDYVSSTGTVTSESEEDSEEDSDTDYEYSPMEIATPVTFCTPMKKPTVITVVELRPQRPSVTSTSSMSSTSSARSSISTYNSQHISQSRSDNDYGVPIPEAESFEVFASISSGVASPTSSLEDTASVSDQSITRRKSSVPMLSRFTHARLNSIKGYIKPQSVLEVRPAVPAIPSMHHYQSSPSPSFNPAWASTPSPIYLNKTSGEYETFDRPPPRRSFTEPRNHFRRTSTVATPHTAHPARGNTDRVAHGTTKQSTVDVVDAGQDLPLMKPKKSFTNLRRRSGSLGQVLKFSNDKNKSPILDSNPPPVPAINTDNYAAFGYGPTPSERTSSRKSGLLVQSPFLAKGQVQTSAGLGLRL